MELRITRLENPDADLMDQVVTKTILREAGERCLGPGFLNFEWVVPNSKFGESIILTLSKQDIAVLVQRALKG